MSSVLNKALREASKKWKSTAKEGKEKASTLSQFSSLPEGDYISSGALFECKISKKSERPMVQLTLPIASPKEYVNKSEMKFYMLDNDRSLLSLAVDLQLLGFDPEAVKLSELGLTTVSEMVDSVEFNINESKSADGRMFRNMNIRGVSHVDVEDEDTDTEDATTPFDDTDSEEDDTDSEEDDEAEAEDDDTDSEEVDVEIGTQVEFDGKVGTIAAINEEDSTLDIKVGNKVYRNIDVDSVELA